MASSHAQIDRRSNVGIGEISRRLVSRAAEWAISHFQRAARRMRSSLTIFSGLELGTETQVEKERILIEASLSRPPRFVESMRPAPRDPARCNSKFRIRSIEGDRWTVMDDRDRIVCIGTKEACEDWLDYQDNVSRAEN